jgi:hypothetical protein
MKTAAPGDSIKLYFGGNGHTRGSNAGGTSNPNPLGAGSVSVYWKGAPEQEITDISEFTSANLLQTNGFSEESFSYPADPNIKTPDQGLVDKGNWQTLKLPSNMAAGRHMFVWVWTYAGSSDPQWSTCFDVTIEGAASGADTYSAPAAPASPVADVNVNAAAAAPAPAADTPAPAPQAPATTPAPEPPVTVWDQDVETVYTTVDVWTTVWDYQKRDHIRQFRP